MGRRLSLDRWLLSCTILLAFAGAFMVASASNYFALDRADDPSAFLWKHLVHLALGLGVLVFTITIDYQRLASGRVVLTALVGCLLLLLAVLAMPATNGAHRWLLIGPFRFQPSELAKLVVVLFMAYLLARREDRIERGLAVPLTSAIVVGTAAFLIVIEPDLGSAVMLVLVAAVMIFAAGLAWRHLLAAGGLGALAFAVAVVTQPYRLQRIIGFLNPGADGLGVNFQLQQSLIALGRGGITGTGLGQGQQKAFYLPAAHTDFIFSVLGEEIGLVGTSLLLVLFLVVFWRGMRAAVRAPDRFGFYLALGLTHLIVLQALINMCVCLGLLPTKGLPMPLISYGGSSLLASLAAMGLLLNVSQHSN